MLSIIRDKLLDSGGIGVDLEKPMILVGNKCDLNLQRQVSKEELKELSDNFFGKGKGVPCLEISAKMDTNVNKAFELMLDEIEKFESDGDSVDDENEKNNGGAVVSSGKGCVIM
ncbi:unnamed protein product [Ambrosiozyma monospora]|uniref:Unnamed protein product n=1 Tax=Ambrosiozyma monospora TaxID=43982 RepID=A0ACB5TKS9_AMBMO|nr:unnamed protein product [Ambrosiozyma monospora]